MLLCGDENQDRLKTSIMRTDVEKRKRQELIREIIRSKPIGTQEELVGEIRSRSLDVTQTTVSRDLVELQVGKWNGKYHIPYTSDDSPAWFETIRQHVLEMKKTGDHLVVLKTKAGSSSLVEKTLNDATLPEITGVIASQSTVMIAFESVENQTKIIDLLGKAIS